MARATPQRQAPALDTSGPAPRVGWLSGLDGLRAIAVIAVLLYHGNVGWLPGGFLGVDVFFVISGFLITGLLLREHRVTGRIDILAFWGRRARRLLPALFLLLIGGLGFAALFLPDELARLRSAALAASAYVTNWFLLADQQPYFEAVGRPSMFRHLWSLAVEEQFYLFWPAALAIGLAIVRRRGMLVVAIAAAALSAAWMAALFSPDGDVSRVYYGTDTRLFELLIGAVLALAWLPAAGGRVAVSLDTTRRVGPRDWIAGAGLIALAWAFLALSEYDEVLYRGGLLIVATITAVVIATVIHPNSFVGPKILDSPPLRWLGQRSYGIYLWHWPVFVVTRPGIDIGLDPVSTMALRIGVTVVLAAASYRLVEAPIRAGALGRAVCEWGMRGANAPRRLATATAVVATGLAMLALLARVAIAPPAQAPDYLPAGSLQAVVGDGTEPTTVETGLAATPAPPLDTGSPRPSSHGAPAPAPASATAADPGASASLQPTARPDPSPAETAVAAAALNAVVETPAAAANASPTDLASPVPATVNRSPSTAPPATGAAPAPLASIGQPAAAATQEAASAPASALAAAAAPTASESAGPARSPTPAPASSAPSAEPSAAPLTTAPRAPAAVARILAIGDSVLLGAAHELGRALGRVEVDAVVGRQFGAGVAVLRDRRAAGTLPDVVILHLGDNGPITSAQIQALLEATAGITHVVLVNVRIPDEFEAHNNRMLADAARHGPNIVFVDWHAASADRPELFWNDGEHLRPNGAEFYAALIAQALRDAGVVRN